MTNLQLYKSLGINILKLHGTYLGSCGCFIDSCKKMAIFSLIHYIWVHLVIRHFRSPNIAQLTSSKLYRRKHFRNAVSPIILLSQYRFVENILLSTVIVVV